MPITKLDHLNEAALALIHRAQKTGQDDDWQGHGQWDLNAWNPDDLPADDDANWHVTVYPVIDGDTDAERGIVLRGHYTGDSTFPTPDAIDVSLFDEDLAGQLAEFWVIERTEGPSITVTPKSWASCLPSLVWPYDPTAGG